LVRDLSTFSVALSLDSYLSGFLPISCCPPDIVLPSLPPCPDQHQLFCILFPRPPERGFPANVLVLDEGQLGASAAFQPYCSSLDVTHREIPWFRVYSDASTADLITHIGKSVYPAPLSAADVRMHCFVHRALLCLLTPRYVYLFVPRSSASHTSVNIDKSACLVCVSNHSRDTAVTLNASSNPLRPTSSQFVWRLLPDDLEVGGCKKRVRDDEGHVFVPTLASKIFSYVAPANNGFIVEQVLLNLFPNLRPRKQYDDADVVWKPSLLRTPDQVVSKWRSDGTRLFHVNGHSCISAKHLLADTVLSGVNGSVESFLEYCPFTIQVKLPLRDAGAELLRILRSEDTLKLIKQRPCFGQTQWIIKPAELWGALGIQICADADAAVSLLRQEKKSNIFIVQKYIERPMLLLGHKFDLRIFFMLVPTAPRAMSVLFARKKFYARLSHQPYDPSSLDRTVHLTNSAIQLHSDSFKMHYNFDELKAALGSGHDLDAVMERVAQCLKKFLGQPGMLDRFNPELADPRATLSSRCELFGCDFILDEDSNPYLLEVNTNPALDNELGPTFFHRLLDCVFRLAFRMPVVDDFFENLCELK
jgi:hypothetical protein